MKFAIVMLIFYNEIYLVGACISAWVHKKYIEQLNLDIKLIVMVDENIYKYKKDLEQYFDKIILIELLELKLNPKYQVINKYSKWMKYSINKWQILKFDKYDKILFIDVDILPINQDFYNIFKIKTPGIMVRGFSENKTFDSKFFLDKIDLELEDYYDISTTLKYSIDAGIILLKPDKKLYDEYIEFLKICEGNNGYISKYDSGIDETTLLLFLLFYKKIKLYSIPYDYAVIPWDKFPYNKNNVNGINYLSMIKPWIKLPIIQWADENIWHIVVKKAFKKDSILTKLYLKFLINQLYKFSYNYKKNLNKHNSPYNMECIKNKYINKNTFELFNFLKLHNENNLSNSEIEEIISQTIEIHKKMNKSQIISIDNFIKFINTN